MAHAAPPSPNLPVDDSPEQEYKQPIAPLIIIASILMAIGFYFAVARSDAKMKFDAAPFTMAAFEHTIPSPLQPTSLDKGLRLDWSSATTGNYRMQQTSRRKAGAKASEPVMADMTFTATRQPAKDNKVALALSKARVQMRQGTDSKNVGADIAAQIQTVLNKGEARLLLDAKRQVKNYKWTSSTNPQLRPTLRLVANGQSLLFPRFRAGGLKPGDTWSYDLPWAGKQDDVVKTDAVIRFDLTYKGIFEKDGNRFAIMETIVKTSGSISADGQKTAITGTGQGSLWMNLKTNQIHRFGFTLNQSMATEKISQSSVMSFEVSAP